MTHTRAEIDAIRNENKLAKMVAAMIDGFQEKGGSLQDAHMLIHGDTMRISNRVMNEGYTKMQMDDLLSTTVEYLEKQIQLLKPKKKKRKPSAVSDESGADQERRVRRIDRLR